MKNKIGNIKDNVKRFANENPEATIYIFGLLTGSIISSIIGKKYMDIKTTYAYHRGRLDEITNF